jgi:hypothetical protein
MTTAAHPTVRGSRMTLWRLEWLRLIRTPRAIALGATYIAFGLIVVVVLAAGTFSFDARHGLATFLRTRVASIWQLVLPRFAINAAAAAIAYLLGTLAAAYETRLLIGSLPAGGTLAGVLRGAAYPRSPWP